MGRSGTCCSLTSFFSSVWTQAAVSGSTREKEKQKNRRSGKKKFGNEEINQEVREKTAEAFLQHTQTHTLLLAGSVLNVHMAPLCDGNRLGFVDLR